MNIWKVIKNEGYNNAFLINANGKQCFDKISDYMEISEELPTRLLKIEVTGKGFPDIMNYWGASGAVIVNAKVKMLIEQYYGGRIMQFLPCSCSDYPNLELWIWKVCEFHDVLDLNKSICDRIVNLQGKEVIKSVDKYIFREESFKLDFFKIYLEERKYTTYLFMSDGFKRVMEENNVTGLAVEGVFRGKEDMGGFAF